MFKAIDRLGLFLKNWSISKKILAVIFVIGFVISLIPIIITCFYSVPVYDDYNFGYYTHRSVVNGSSFLVGGIETCVDFYNNWQGFFTSTFWASVQPFNVNVSLYFISNLIVLLLIISSILYLGKVILIDIFKTDLSTYLIIVLPIIFMYIQFMPSLGEGLYWMDGSLANSINAISIYIFSFIIKFYSSKEKSKKILYAILTILFTLSICGSLLLLYITVMEFCAVSIVYSIKKKNSVTKLLITVMLVYSLGIIIAAIAPGNANRLATSNGGMSMISSIFHALFYSVVKFGEWSSLFYISILAIIGLAFYPVAQKSKYSFKNPLLVFVLLYLLYASRMSIQLYTLGYLGAPRQINEYYFGYIICFTISFLYFVGWFSKRNINPNKLISKKGISVVFLVFVSFFMFCGCCDFGIKSISSVSTTLSLVKGETQQYHYEMIERIKLIENSSSDDVTVSKISCYPPFFGEESLSEDPEYWTNRSVARYYGKKSVCLK